MKKNLILILLIFTTSSSVFGNEEYKYCELTGLALGADKEFVASISMRVLQKNGKLGDTTCQAVWRDAYKIGAKLSTGEMKTKEDFEIWDKLQNFENKILDSIMNNMKLD